MKKDIFKINKIELSNAKGRYVTIHEDGTIFIHEHCHAPKYIVDAGSFTINQKAFEKYFKMKLVKTKQ
jgi:hypothetical protein